MDSKIAHLGFIQGVITRMNANSFLLKGWAVALAVGISAISTSNSSSGYLILAFFSVLAFWCFDAYYLHQEKLFRALYKSVVSENISIEKFSMDTNLVRKNTDSYCTVMFSGTITFFYLPILLIVIFLIYQSHFFDSLIRN